MRHNLAVLSWDEMIKSSDADEQATFNCIEDPIAISCVLYRMRTEDEDVDGRKPHLFNIQTDSALLARSITPEDRFLAQNIRSYYNGKLVVSTLRNENLSKFRKDLVTLLAMTPDDQGQYVVPVSFVGMLYKLPYFYEYDRDLINIFDGEYFEVTNRKHGNTGTLTYIRRLDMYRKRLPQYEYWFLDEEDNRVAVILEKSNPLVPMFEHYVSNNDVQVNGFFRHSKKDNLTYYKLTDWKIEF